MRRVLFLVLFMFCFASLPAVAAEQGKWAGIDEMVVGKYAADRGRGAAEPWIQGDLLLFLFTVAGAAGGFVAGYHWHKLFVAGKKAGETPDAK